MSDSPTGDPTEPDEQPFVPQAVRAEGDHAVPGLVEWSESEDVLAAEAIRSSGPAAAVTVDDGARDTEPAAPDLPRAVDEAPTDGAPTGEAPAGGAPAGEASTGEASAPEAAPGPPTMETDTVPSEDTPAESGGEGSPIGAPEARASSATAIETDPVAPKSTTPEADSPEPATEETAPQTSDSGPTIVPPGEEHAPLAMQILGGKVTAVSNREVDLTLDDGRPAVIHRENFDLAGTDPTTVLQVGDGAEGAVLSREDPQNRVVLSRKWVLRDRAWKKAADSIADHSTINCRITGASKKGIVVDMMGLRGFVPLNHFQMGSDAPGADTIGQMVELRVLAADRQKDRLLLSRRAALLKEQRKAENEAFQSLKVGDIYTGVVSELTAFGAFVTVNGVRGLLHVSEMSWDRVSSPKGLVTVGDEIQVQVIELKAKKRRVSFSIKSMLTDPLAGIEVGSILSGTVKRLVDYGVFVDIGPTEGMVHLSELAEYRPSHPSEIVLRGDEVQVKVLKVNREKRRVELSMRQALYFPA